MDLQTLRSLNGIDTEPRTHNHGEAKPPSYRASTGRNSSFDVTQRLESKLARYNASQTVIKRWLIEILSVAISAICMGMIFKLCTRNIRICLMLTQHRRDDCNTHDLAQSSAQKMASWSGSDQCALQNCLSGTDIAYIRGHWTTEMFLVLQTFTSRDRLRNI
jgi:hypothetical protein